MDKALTSCRWVRHPYPVEQRIAVVGSGISGLTAAWLLSQRHQVTLFERDTRLGGHTHTVVVETPDGPLPLDTGFLVHNRRTYPHLIRLFDAIGIQTQPSDMSFAVSCARTGLEYGSRGPAGFFAQPANLVRPTHWRLLANIVRFNAAARTLLQSEGAAEEDLTLAAFLDAHGFHADLRTLYLYPMAAAIWSTSLDSVDRFPARSIARFLENHGLLALTGQPEWRVVVGGSHTYIPKLTAPLHDRVRLGATVSAVTREAHGITLTVQGCPTERFDHVVLACHGDQVLPLLGDATDAERRVFSAFATTSNDAWLHTDASVLPSRPAARASWNYRLDGDVARPPRVTYHLNRLLSLRTRETYCVTLNPAGEIDPARVIRRMTYRHPQYTGEAVAAQRAWQTVSGVSRTHYVGAYWRYGFHEDGVWSARRAAAALGVTW